MFQLLEENLVKLLAYAIAALVALLMAIHVLGSVDWLALIPDSVLPDLFGEQDLPSEDDCVVMPDGLRVCEPDTLQGDRQ